MTPHEARARRLFLAAKTPRVPGVLADACRDIQRDAWDHDDAAEYLQAIRIAGDAAQRIREIAAGCSRAGPLAEMAEHIEGAAWPLEREAMHWDDERDARADGNRLDMRRLVRSE